MAVCVPILTVIRMNHLGMKSVNCPHTCTNKPWLQSAFPGAVIQLEV